MLLFLLFSGRRRKASEEVIRWNGMTNEKNEVIYFLLKEFIHIDRSDKRIAREYSFVRTEIFSSLSSQMGANNSNRKFVKDLCQTPPATKHRLLFDPRSPSGEMKTK